MALINTTTTGVLGSTFFGDGTGSLTVQQNGVTQGIYGNIPAFSAYFSGNPSLSASTQTKIAANTELFDTNNNYDTSNYRFTPTVAGYYFVTVMAKIYTGTSQTSFTKSVYIYKNGSSYKEVSIDGNFGYSNNNHALNITSLVFCNGTTDYVEAYALIGVAGNLIGGAPQGNTFEAYLAKAT
jgi:hypothetical protein